MEKPKPQHDDIIIACAPYPTNKAHSVLPRYLTRVTQVDCEIEEAAAAKKLIDQNYKSYFEGVQFKILDEMSTQQCIWLKPEFNCPQGATLWIASQLRKISIKSKVEYLQEQKAFHLKQEIDRMQSVLKVLRTVLSDLKLAKYKGNLSNFVERFPEAKAYYDLKASSLKFKFPQPGALQGVRSKGKAILSMKDVGYRYPTADFDQIHGVNLRVSMASRVACVGANGAGKSTMIKLLTGELQPDKKGADGKDVGEVWKHPNARVAYVAQHAFFHIENHLEKTPNEYIRWRYEHGSDKEGLEKITTKDRKSVV